MSIRLLLLTALCLPCCHQDVASVQRDQCTAALQSSLNPWSSLTDTLSDEMHERRLALAVDEPSPQAVSAAVVAQRQLCEAQSALSMAAAAYVQHRVYGGDYNRNSALDVDAREAGLRAAAAFTRALRANPTAPDAARDTANGVVLSCH